MRRFTIQNVITMKKIGFKMSIRERERNKNGMRSMQTNEFRWNYGRQTIGSHLIGMSINKSTHNRFVIESFQFSSVQFGLVQFCLQPATDTQTENSLFQNTRNKNCNDSQIWTQLTHLRVRLLRDSSQFCSSFFFSKLIRCVQLSFFISSMNRDRTIANAFQLRCWYF